MLLTIITKSNYSATYKKKYLANEHLVERLANSYVLRRLAQVTHNTYIRVTHAGQKSLDKYSKQGEVKSQVNNKNGTENSFVLGRFVKRFYENVQQEIEKNNRK